MPLIVVLINLGNGLARFVDVLDLSLVFSTSRTLNYAAVYSLWKELNLEGDQYSYIASITNIGYLIGWYHSNICLQKLHIGNFISLCTIVMLRDSSSLQEASRT